MVSQQNRTGLLCARNKQYLANVRLTPIQQYQPISDFSHPLFIAGLFAALLIGIIAIFRVLAHIYMFCCGQTDKRICLCGIAHTLFCYACSFAIHDLMCGQSLCC